MVTVRTTAMTMYKNDIEDLIRQRKSVRSYDGNKVSMEQKKELLEFAKDLNNETYEFEIIDIDLAEGVKIGTYGYIKNAKTYLIAIADESLGSDNEMAIRFGYDFEKLVLKATDMGGLGTCWMGMSYKENDITRLVGTDSSKRIAMVSPLGVQKGKHLMERITRSVISADKRKKFGDLFFLIKTGKVLLMMEVLVIMPMYLK